MTVPITSLERADICYVNLDNDTVANEQRGERPCVIIAKQEQVRFVVIIPLTTTKEAIRFSSTLEIKRSEINQLKEDSVAMIFQIRAISVDRLTTKRGFLEDRYFSDILKLLATYLGLNGLGS